MKNILVAIDTNENAQELVKMAATIAEKFLSKIWVLHIAEPEPDFVGDSVGPQYIRDIKAQELRKEHRIVQQFADELKGKGIEAQPLLIAGATVQTILEEMEKYGITLLIIGHHQHSVFYKIFTGATDTALINKSQIPVLIIPMAHP
jgi:nucleotide-binding universal stress UspA family protein